MKVSTRRSRLTINAICHTVKVNTSSVTYALGRTNSILSIANDRLLFTFIFTSHLADTALLNQVSGLLTCLWQGAPGYTADERLATPLTIPVPTWHLRANLSVHQEPPATNKFKIWFTYILMRIFSSLLHRVTTTRALDQHMWLSTPKSHICLSNTVKTQQFSTCKQWRFLWLVSHLPTVGGKQTNGQYSFTYTFTRCGKYPQVTNVCETHQSWERGLKLFNPLVPSANAVGMWL